MLEISLEGTTRFDSLGRRLRVATEKKMVELTDLLYNKVMENISGRILQKRSGALASSIQRSVDLTQEVMVGSVFPEPADPKAWALEKGGTSNYPIVSSKGAMLKFYWDKAGKTVFLSHVDHPASKEFAYLRTALEEIVPEVPRGFQEYIQTVLDGGDFG